MRKSSVLISSALAIIIPSAAACARNGGAVPAAGAAAAAPQAGAQQNRRFIPAEGADLKARLDNAVKRGRSDARQTSFWTAYSFDVRPGVAVDIEVHHGDGIHFMDGVSVSLDSRAETRNVAVFLLHRAGQEAVADVQIYNLERARDYRGHPVYWLGRAGNEESLNFLTKLAEAGTTGRIAERAVMAVAIHDDARVPGVLKNLARNPSLGKARAQAALWLGQFPEERAFLIELARDERENTEVRKHAVLGLGMGKDSAALAALRNVYDAVTNRQVKEHVFVAASSNENEDAAVDFLIGAARKEPDRETRKQAIFWLGQKAGERSLIVLGEMAEASDGETEVQKQAVFALSQKPR
ncbi:MAG: HEAT repeat domain-containing protein, partial [Pyrinomonadaceae bacterium]